MESLIVTFLCLLASLIKKWLYTLVTSVMGGSDYNLNI
ncbi:hypothetical protein QGW_3330 [Clostridioides difficile 824]|nr:hypothetical protein QAS_3382 [Clostridioides difficile CD9]EQE55473.1 hypothetical protein QCI_3186 [Clostridioides difficile CD44]EQE73225.1 hypothetical protein QCQ_3386 [Clostridioides difficile CD49]EQE75570.1 hypothetical protein QCS_3221 [Clostridioides difficile CD51]EQE88673.1 hypothetical protein QCY_3316 [Clostridioides difficile CD70]EQF04014.1 hypothetical protein QEM_3023 [Clostridioides difficile CD132]EQF30541.1 hypothetical protein QEY_3244 [Clostridioides difficile CD165]